jgi:nicotinamidase-related amidase
MTKTALLIIDMQNDFAGTGNHANKIIPKVKEVLNFFRDNKLPVFHIYREYRADGSDIEMFRLKNFLNNSKICVPDTFGSEIVEELKPLKNEYKIMKNRFSAFMNTELDLILRRLYIKNIVITGTQYPNCIRATAFDGICYDYNVTVITDATSAETIKIAEANILDMQNIGINCITFKKFLQLNNLN